MKTPHHDGKADAKSIGPLCLSQFHGLRKTGFLSLFDTTNRIGHGELKLLFPKSN